MVDILNDMIARSFFVEISRMRDLGRIFFCIDAEHHARRALLNRSERIDESDKNVLPSVGIACSDQLVFQSEVVLRIFISVRVNLTDLISVDEQGSCRRNGYDFASELAEIFLFDFKIENE